MDRGKGGSSLNPSVRPGVKPERRSFNHGIQVSTDNRVLLNLKKG
jgi:hypothetical protein